MRHPQSLLIFALLSFPAFGAGESKKWTHGKSNCDPLANALATAGANPDHLIKPLDQALEYSYQDIEFLRGLKCFPAAGQAADELSSQLKNLEMSMMAGMRAASCSSDQSAQAKLALLRDSLEKMKAAEPVLEFSLEKAERLKNVVAGEVPEGTAFDDCRSKAARGWATARLTLNKLSCEVMRSMQILETVDERVAMECPAYRAPAVAAAPPAPAPTAVIMFASPVEAKPNP